jgi:tripeptidyl-peptidase-1
MNDSQDELRRLASSISDPRQVLFRQHLSAEQLLEFVQAPEHAFKDVKQWLSEAGIPTSDILLGGNVVEAMTNVSTAETLLNTTYNVYVDDEGTTVIRTKVYDLPKKLQDAVTFVSPTTVLPVPRKQRLLADINPDSQVNKRQASCGANDQTTPACVRQIYNITYTPKPNRTTFAVCATEAALYSSSDLKAFLQTYNPPATDAEYTVIGSGNSSNGSPGIGGAFETALDTQTALGLAWPAQGILYNLGGVFGPNKGEIYDPFVQFLQDLIHNDTVPSVVSFSESMPENQMNPEYAKSLCDMMMQVGTRGVTLLFSSGDNGPQGDQPTGTHKNIFEPEFPASCPWVTAVGGTTNMVNETAATQDTLTGLINKLSYTASGGGFSELFSRPSYQDSAVTPYISNKIPASYASKSGFNPAGRGIPDISAFSTSFPVIWNGIPIPIGGTSASTPLWAAVIALLNDYEASKGRPSLGFINPWLYSLEGGGGLKDITTGWNSKGACYLLGGCTLSETDGFDVVEGWDPVTGLGSPIWNELVASLDSLAA